MDPLRFLAGCRKGGLNQAVSVLSLSLGLFVCVCCANYGHFLRWVIIMCCVFCLLVVLVRFQYQCRLERNSPKFHSTSLEL